MKKFTGRCVICTKYENIGIVGKFRVKFKQIN